MPRSTSSLRIYHLNPFGGVAAGGDHTSQGSGNADLYTGTSGGGGMLAVFFSLTSQVSIFLDSVSLPPSLCFISVLFQTITESVVQGNIAVGNGKFCFFCVFFEVLVFFLHS